MPVKGATHKEKPTVDVGDIESPPERETGRIRPDRLSRATVPLSGPRRKIIVAWFLFCALLLAFHFVAVFLYLAPRNPVSAWSAETVNAYIRPYFQQNWELFAPDPIDYNTRVLVRARIRDSSGAERITPWTDISEPGRERIRGSLFPGRLSRLVIGGHEIMNDSDVAPTTTSPETEDTAERPSESGPPDPTAQSQAVRHMSAIATLAARAAWGDGITAVQVRISTRPAPRFAIQDQSDDGETYDSDFGWWSPSPTTDEAVRLWKEAFG
ncbi:hypothetical protein JYK22_14510, partial [Nonomuraea sp. RK-328]|nr:hypothetical protein [Nonomuraea sp. RK-328]